MSKNKKTVIILRGVSGAGKTSFIDLVAEPKVVCCADHYFERDGKYEFDATKLGAAHKQSMDTFDAAMVDPNVENIIVANTNVKPSDYKYYTQRAEAFGFRVVYVVLEKRHKAPNVHGVPEHVVQRQHDSLKNSLKLM